MLGHKEGSVDEMALGLVEANNVDGARVGVGDWEGLTSIAMTDIVVLRIQCSVCHLHIAPTVSVE